MSSDKAAPLVLKRYRIVRRLAQGGMGVVYLGRVEGAAGFSKAVIIKRVIPDAEHLEESTARFIREAQILSHLQHPSIVSVLDFGKEQDGYAMVLEYMHGYDLGRWLKYLAVTSTKLPWEEAVYVMLRVLDGLYYAHTFQRSDGTAAGVLHRDISPGNILLDVEGQVRLLDFGIARMAQEDTAQYKTQEGVLRGKVGFLAPELFSASPPSTSSDIYACAVVLYQMLAGFHPFSAQSDSQTMWRVITEMPRPLSSLRNDLPGGLEAAVFRSLAKDPEDRHESAEAFARALRGLLTRHEADIHVALRQRLRRDFTGEMPAVLSIEPLVEREQAWTLSRGPSDPEVTPLRSSRVPPPDATLPVHGVQVPRLRPAPSAAPTEAPSVPESLDGAAAPPESKRRRGTAGWVLGVAIAVPVGGALALWGASSAPPAPGRFIVVESPGAAGAGRAPLVAAAAGAEVRLAAESPAPGSAGPPSGDAARPAPAAGGESEQNAVARQLTRRQGALQECVRQAPVRSEPVQVTLSIEIAVTGRVSAARLVPESVEATLLGQCLLRVAKETEFQPLREPLSLSLPLNARAVSR